MKYDRTIIGYHGCDAAVAERILAGQSSFQESRNSYDWLGSGIYFWEYGSHRALEFARFQMQWGRVKTPAVVGAVIQLGNCFDLMDTRFTAHLGDAHRRCRAALRASGQSIPKNRGKTPDRKLRDLDCAVLNFTLQTLADGGVSFDTVRCAFSEGKRAFRGSMIRSESHIQLAVRNPDCIVGVFRPMMEKP